MDISWSTIAWDHLFLAHFACAMLIIAILCASVDWLLQKIKRLHHHDLLLRWLLLLPVGIASIYAALMHLFIPSTTAAMMGLKMSPFQEEVSIGYLSIGLLGILSFKANYGFRLATVIAVTIWMWGHAIAQIFQIIMTSNIYLGNAVSWFWIDALLPFVLIHGIRKTRPQPITVVHQEEHHHEIVSPH